MEAVRVAVPGETITGGTRTIMAGGEVGPDPVIAAVNVTVCCVTMSAGAVYRPLPSMVPLPVAGERVQVKPMHAPKTDGTNCWVWELDSTTVAGVMPTACVVSAPTE